MNAGGTASRAVRIRPLRKRTVEERAIALPEGTSIFQCVEVWIVGDLVAVIRPGTTPARTEMLWGSSVRGRVREARHRDDPERGGARLRLVAGAVVTTYEAGLAEAALWGAGVALCFTAGLLCLHAAWVGRRQDRKRGKR